MNLGERVKQERLARKWTQAHLAERAGLSQQALAVLENRDSRTSDRAVELADALQVSLRWLLTGQGRPDDLDWPFRRVDRARWDRCDDIDRGYVQAAVNRALDDCEKSRPPFDADVASSKSHSAEAA